MEKISKKIQKEILNNLATFYSREMSRRAKEVWRKRKLKGNKND